ncbi:MAG: M1 family aminopeptidase [Deltaproteobacteria bacterium]|nr:M1 family aminopeptidase [Deltaproteobacteria bacterium]
MRRPLLLALSLVLLLSACSAPSAAPDGGADGGADGGPSGPPPSNWERSLLSADLSFDLAAHSATAALTFAPHDTPSASLRVGDLVLERVLAGGVEAVHERRGDELALRIADEGEPVVVEIDYRFTEHTDLDGLLPTGVTLTWPTHCGNLFPCRPDPSEGATYTLDVQGLPAGEVAIHPARIDLPAPAYMVAFAVGDYTYRSLGTSAAGTEVGLHFLPGGEATATRGTANLLAYVDTYEALLGRYPFGDRLAAVEVSWTVPAAGGIEHHPFFHVSTQGMGSNEVHAHEAAHGWFGDGVRIACWEDLVLSEGTTQYLAWRAIEAVDGPGTADSLRAIMERRLASAVNTADTEAYPDTCGVIDLLDHPLWSRIPYEKGAFFFDEVDDRIGRPALDAALARFVSENLGRAAHMSDLIATIEAEAGQPIDDLVDRWLRSLGVPP